MAPGTATDTTPVPEPRAARRTIRVPLNRIEGDLEVRAEIEGGVVVDAWAGGTSFRGIERVLLGRSPLDALVVTPRVCGICSTAHLTAAARALDALTAAPVPPDAVRVRNVALAMELLQSDLRHAFLLFAVDFVNPAYRALPLHDRAVRRYAPFRGEATLAAIRASRRLVEVIAVLGGQWPHSSYMVPGGITSLPGRSELETCRLAVEAHRRWYEQRVLGCSLERWARVGDAAALDAWLDERPEHRESELGFFLRFAAAAGFDRYGAGHAAWLSVGAFDDPAAPGPPAPGARGGRLVPAGLVIDGAAAPFVPGALTEDVSHAWFDDDTVARHPAEGRTEPAVPSSTDPGRYSWAKAPRHDGAAAETGPLAERLVAGDPLFTDLVAREGATARVRQLARLLRHAWLLPAVAGWLAALTGDGPYYESTRDIPDGAAFGLTEAARGALGHWVRVEQGRISGYQVVAPTTWNASPRDARGQRGPLEEALVGTPVADPENPIELGHVVRSFDPCLVCTVHTIRAGRTVGRLRSGATA